jgi:hypothetical protein
VFSLGRLRVCDGVCHHDYIYTYIHVHNSLLISLAGILACCFHRTRQGPVARVSIIYIYILFDRH